MDNAYFSEGAIRLAAFGGIFLTMALWESFAPRRELRYGRGWRWITNWGVLLCGSLVVRLAFPMAAVGVALVAEKEGWGLLTMLNAPYWLAAVVGFLILDFAVWLEHYVSHKWPLLWRIHKVHHADPDLDVTTALRFHPLEILLSMVWKSAIVVALGVPVVAVLFFEIVLNGAAMFNHANANLPRGLDRALRLMVVTPDMHRVHHSVYRHEADTNFGFNLSVWDRIFRTYKDRPQDGHQQMRIGLPGHQSRAPLGLIWSILFPFRRGE